MACGLFDYKAGKAQKPCLPLANVMSKLGDVTKETIEAEAARFELEIPEEQWVARVAQRGRPKKPDSEKKAQEPKEKKKRGRPATKKAKTQESAPADDLIASLVADAMKSTEQPVVVETEPVVEEPVSPSCFKKAPPSLLVAISTTLTQFIVPPSKVDTQFATLL